MKVFADPSSHSEIVDNVKCTQLNQVRWRYSSLICMCGGECFSGFIMGFL